jgi:hypothetical protein
LANGSHKEGPARGDRYREKYARMFKRTQAKLDKVPISRDLPAYREEMDSHSEVTVGIGERVKVGAKGIPPRALGAALVILALAAAVVAVVRAWG